MGKMTWGWIVVAGLGVLLLLFSWQQGEVEELRQKIALLEAEVSELTAKVDVADRRQAPTEHTPVVRRPAMTPSGTATPEEDSRGEPDEPSSRGIPSEVQGLARARRLGGDNPERQVQLRAIVDALEEEDSPLRGEFRKLVRKEQDAIWDEFRERRQAAWEKRTNERLEKLATSASLTSEQVDALYATMTAARDRIGEVFRGARESQNFDKAHDEAARIRTEADAEARQLLNEDQYKAYEEMQKEQRRDRRRRHREMRPPEP